MSQYSEKNLIWIDLEMTGLSVKDDVIIEIATIITDSDLTILAEGPVLALAQEQAYLDIMDEWNTHQHNSSGLVKRVLESQVSEREAELQTLDFLQQYVPKGVSPMCGNSICQDRRFLAKYMPQLCSYFHYRHIDVSTLKELYNRWQPNTASQFSKASQHLALEDIRDSIAELEFYRQHFMKV